MPHVSRGIPFCCCRAQRWNTQEEEEEEEEEKEEEEETDSNCGLARRSGTAGVAGHCETAAR